MDIADIVLDYLEVVAWPAVVLAVIIMFRTSIRTALGRLTELSGFGGSARFDAESAAIFDRIAVMSAAQGVADDTPHGAPQSTPENHPRSQEKPRTASLDDVLKHWAALEASLAILLGHSGEPFGSRSTEELVLEGVQTKAISLDTANLVLDLHRLRDEFVHSHGPSARAADDFVRSVQALRRVLKQPESNTQG